MCLDLNAYVTFMDKMSRYHLHFQMQIHRTWKEL